MKISIIIPVYNVAPYVKECIQSVLSQDYKDLEIIIVDDCSTDESMELVMKMITDNLKTVHVLKHSCNQGLSAARNTGIRQAIGDYIFFLDSDDYIEPFCISCLAKVAQVYPNADMIYGSSKAVPERKILEMIVDRTDLKEYYDNRTQIKKKILDSSHFPIAVWNRLIKREWLLKHKLFFKEGIVYEDTHWNFFAAKYAKSIALYKKTTHYYRYNPNGIIMATQIQKSIESIDIIIKDWISHLDSHCLPTQLYSVLHLAHTNYVMKYGGAEKPPYIRVFYPLIYLLKLLGPQNK